MTSAETSRPDFSVAGSTIYACQQIVDYLQPELEGGLKEIDKVQVVERHIGRFDTPDAVKRFLSNRDGGVRIAALRVTSYEHIGGRVVGNVSFAAYVFTADQYGYQKDQRAEVVVGKLVKALIGRGGPATAYSRPENFRADNMYSGAIDELGVALWAVTWNQQWYLDVPIDLSKLDDFKVFGFKGVVDEKSPPIEAEVKLPQ